MGNHNALLSVFGTFDDRTTLDLVNRLTPLDFAPRDASWGQPYVKTRPLRSFGPYRSGQHARQVDVWSKPLRSEPTDGDQSWAAALRVVARVRSGGAARWWSVDVPLDTAEGHVSDKDPVRIDLLPTGPAALPVLVASLDTTSPGHTAEISTTVKLALDFRRETPRVLASLDCSWSDTRQSCTGGYGHKDTDFWTGSERA